MKHFKPFTMVGNDSIPSGPFKSKTMEHIAQKYVFRARTMVIDVGYSASAFELDLKGGVRLLIRHMNQESLEYDEDEKSLYLVFLYLVNGYEKRICPFKEVKEFLQYLEQDEERTTERVFLKPHQIHRYKHFDTLPKIDCPKATTDRLIKAYERKLGAYKTKKKDEDGFHYYEIPFGML